MDSALPKQYLPLGNKIMALHSFELLSGLGETIVVASPEYRHYFPQNGIIFADPGIRRQDSVYNGLQKSSGDWILIHDAARPFIQLTDIHNLLEGARDGRRGFSCSTEIYGQGGFRRSFGQKYARPLFALGNSDTATAPQGHY